MYSPFYDFSPFHTFSQHPGQRRRRQPTYNVSPTYYQQPQPEEYYIPQRRVVHPDFYRQGMPQPQHYRSPSPEEYYSPPSRQLNTRLSKFQSPHSYPKYTENFERHGPFENNSYGSEEEQSSDSEQEDLDLIHSLFPNSVTTNTRANQGNERLGNNKKQHNHGKAHRQHKNSHKAGRAQISPANNRKAEDQRLKEAVRQFERKRAAKIIQRQWRYHYQQRRDEASRKIGKFIRARIEIHQAKQILQCLRQLRSYDNEVNLIQERQSSRVFSHPLKLAPTSTPDSIKVLPVKENQGYLGYEDALLKMLIRIDGVDSMGSDIVRSTRKALVNKTQRLLDQLDDYKKSQYKELISNQNN